MPAPLALALVLAAGMALRPRRHSRGPSSHVEEVKEFLARREAEDLLRRVRALR